MCDSLVTASCMSAAYHKEWCSWHKDIDCTARENLEQSIEHSESQNICISRTIETGGGGGGAGGAQGPEMGPKGACKSCFL